MSLFPLAPIVVFGLSLIGLGFAVLVPSDPRRRLAADNLRRGLPSAVSGEPGAAAPARSLDLLVGRLTPAGMATRVDRLLARAGRPRAWTPHRVLAAKLVMFVLIGGLGVLYAAVLNNPAVILAAMPLAAIGYFVPELLLYSRGIERRQTIGLQLPDTLDQMTIAVEAGLGFDAAMARAGQNGSGPLAEELVRTLQDIQMGRSRRQAYEALDARTDTPDLRRFIRAIIQADAYGISVADVLRAQAAEMRMKRRQRAEYKAMQLPVKVIFPLMFCILPVLFIVLLGPVAISMMRTFG